jgi:hypothetical protein
MELPVKRSGALRYLALSPHETSSHAQKASESDASLDPLFAGIDPDRAGFQAIGKPTPW